MTLPADPSIGLQAAFIALSVAMTAYFVWWTKLRVAPVIWLGATGLLAGVGAFQSFALPPRIMLLMVPGTVALSVLAWRSDWHRSPLKLLVGFQAFRIVVELLIHQAVSEGVAPPQLTWDGRNFDVVTGITALMLIPFVDRMPRWSLHAWNLMGIGLLFNVVGVAVLSMPTPFQVFTPDNLWIAFFPFSWLPLIHVMLAFVGHVVLFKRLTEDAGK